MQLSKIIVAIALVAPAFAVPANFFSGRLVLARAALAKQSCTETCGSTCYVQSDIDDAVDEGYQLYQDGETEGSGKYPHKYNNYEGFDFPVSGPYQEFPILSSYKDYAGGSPGADRVIFNTDGDFAGVITHTGASGDDFIACSGTYIKKI